MRRLLFVFCVVGFLAALPLSHSLLAAPVEKVLICHVNSANDVVDPPHWFMVFGREIEVAPSAVAAHLAHGDSLDYYILDDDLRDHLESLGYSLPNADCWFPVYVP